MTSTYFQDRAARRHLAAAVKRLELIAQCMERDARNVHILCEDLGPDVHRSMLRARARVLRETASLVAAHADKDLA